MSLTVIPTCKSCKGLLGPIETLKTKAVLESGTFDMHHPGCLPVEKRTTWEAFFKFRDELEKRRKAK